MPNAFVDDAKEIKEENPFESMMERFDEAERVFERMLWLNPSDNQGARFLLRDVRARRPWVDDELRGAATSSPA